MSAGSVVPGQRKCRRDCDKGTLDSGEAVVAHPPIQDAVDSGVFARADHQQRGMLRLLDQRLSDRPS
jgi:hypothetical protein